MDLPVPTLPPLPPLPPFPEGAMFIDLRTNRNIFEFSNLFLLLFISFLRNRVRIHLVGNHPPIWSSMADPDQIFGLMRSINFPKITILLMIGEIEKNRLNYF